MLRALQGILSTAAGRTGFHQGFRYFLMTGFSATLTLGLPILLHEGAGIAERLSVGLSLATAFVVNFVTIRYVVFRSLGDPVAELIRFAMTSLGFRVGEYVMFLLLHSIVGVFYVLALGIVLFASFVLKFLCYRFLVFTPGRTGRVDR